MDYLPVIAEKQQTLPKNILYWARSTLLRVVWYCNSLSPWMGDHPLAKAGLPIYHPLFPDFYLIFYSFPYSVTNKKIIFILYFECAKCITLNLGVTLTGKNFSPQGSKLFPLRVAPNEKGDGLRLSHEKVHLSPFDRINKFSEDCHSLFIFKFPDFSLTFQVLSKFPWPSTKFPDFSLTWKKNSFSRHFPCQWQPWLKLMD